jgi:hypothetical protein
MSSHPLPLLALLLVLLTSACSHLLPASRNQSTHLTSFEEARAAIEVLVPMKSQRQELELGGFNPVTHPNIRLLTQADVVRRFLPSSLVKREELDPGILACLEARDDCRGMEIIISKIDRVRDGGFFSDFFNFERHTTITGWRFNATVLFVNDLVVYRTWGGQPKVNETENTRNPLGPLQGIGG